MLRKHSICIHRLRILEDSVLRNKEGKKKNPRSSHLLPLKPPKKKVKKTVERCSSPSHFLVSAEEEAKFIPDFARHLPSRQKLDKVLRATSVLYHQPKKIEEGKVSVASGYDTTQYPTVDLLLSPLAKPHPLDIWSVASPDYTHLCNAFYPASNLTFTCLSASHSPFYRSFLLY